MTRAEFEAFSRRFERGVAAYVRNLTPHPVVLVSDDGETLCTFPPSGTVARVSSASGMPCSDGPLPAVCAPTWGAVEGLPGKPTGYTYIVSALVAAQCPHRGDVFSPGTGPGDNPLRNDAGQIVGVRRFVCAAGPANAPLSEAEQIAAMEAVRAEAGQRIGSYPHEYRWPSASPDVERIMQRGLEASSNRASRGAPDDGREYSPVGSGAGGFAKRYSGR